MSAEQLWDFDKVLMRLWVLSFSWMWPILEKRSEILDKNFISNIWIFQAFEIQKNVQKLTSFVLSNNNSALYIWLCFRTHTRTVQPSCSFVTWRPTLYNFTYVDFFFPSCSAAAVLCMPVFPVIAISKQSTWFTGHRLDQMETSEVLSDALSNSFMPWLVLSLINK